MAVHWVPVVTDSSFLPLESGRHDSQHTDSPQGHMSLAPGPKPNAAPHSGLPDHWSPCGASCGDSVYTSKRVSALMALTEPDTPFTPQGYPLQFQEEIHSLPFLKTGTPLGLSFVFLFLKNILLP